jgi:hypothetical protein
MNQADLERLNGYDILHLARATRNAAFVESTESATVRGAIGTCASWTRFTPK